MIRWPALYDALNRVFFFGGERAFRERTVALAAVAPGHAVLDVGCGTGSLTMAAKLHTGANGEVHGIDPAPEMIRAAERKASREELEIRYQVGVIEELPFPDGHFDIVLSSLMLHHLPADLKRRGVAEIARVLKPGGRFAAVDFDPPLLRNLRIVEESMHANGFTGIQKRRATPWLVHFLGGTLGPE